MPSFSLRRALVGVLGLAALVAVACGGDPAVAPPQAAQEPAAAATVAATTQSPAAPAVPAAAAPAQAAMPAATVAPAPMRATATPVVAARATVAPAPAAPAPAPVTDPVSVVTTSNIVADWVDVVGGDRVDVNSLLAAGRGSALVQSGSEGCGECGGRRSCDGHRPRAGGELAGRSYQERG